MQKDTGFTNLVNDLPVNHKDSTTGRRVKHSRGCNQKSARFLKLFVTGQEVGPTSSSEGQCTIYNLPPHIKFTNTTKFTIGSYLKKIVFSMFVSHPTKLTADQESRLGLGVSTRQKCMCQSLIKYWVFEAETSSKQHLAPRKACADPLLPGPA